jgi:hypothetical protein
MFHGGKAETDIGCHLPFVKCRFAAEGLLNYGTRLSDSSQGVKEDSLAADGSVPTPNLGPGARASLTPGNVLSGTNLDVSRLFGHVGAIVPACYVAVDAEYPLWENQVNLLLR